MQLDWLDGETTEQCGQEVRPVNHSLRQANNKEQTMKGISGQSGSISSDSASLQSYLVSKLAQRLHTAGLTHCKPIWNRVTTPVGRSLYRLMLSEHSIDATDSGLWPTPTRHNAQENGYPAELKRNTIPLGAMNHIINLPTPLATDIRNRGGFDSNSVKRRQQIGKSISLSMMVQAAAWPTPTTQSNVQIKGQYSKTTGTTLAGAAQGLSQSYVETIRSDISQLNPRFSLWLMGYGIEWAYCAERVTLLSRKSQLK